MTNVDPFERIAAMRRHENLRDQISEKGCRDMERGASGRGS